MVLFVGVWISVTWESLFLRFPDFGDTLYRANFKTCLQAHILAQAPLLRAARPLTKSKQAKHMWKPVLRIVNDHATIDS